MHLTGAERELMEFFWNADKPLPLSALADSPLKDTWDNRSSFALTTKLVNKGVLREAGSASGLTGRLVRLFEPAVTREEYLSMSMRTQNWDITMPSLFSALLKSKSIQPSDLQELDTLLKEAKQAAEKDV